MLASALVGACATGVPADVDAPSLDAVDVDDVRRDARAHRGARVRWGGSILRVENLRDHTDIELLARPLTESGRPQAESEPRGRFIARLPGFVDPAEYPKDRLLTVVGIVGDVVIRPVGEYPYRYPVLTVSGRHLWPEATAAPERYPSGPWYDPWFGPAPWYRPWYGPWYGPW